MKKQLLFLSLLTVTFCYTQELLVVDLSTTDEITITATTNASAATISGSDATGFYFENFFTTEQPLSSTLVSGTLTSASETPDNSPVLFRSGGTDPGLNVYSYTDDPSSNFTTGEQAFSGTATWTLSPETYAAMLNAPSSGNIYFPADDATDIAGATLIGTYSVTTALSVSEVQSNNFAYYPNPVSDVLNISAQKVIEQVDIYNMLGQYVSVQKLNAVDGTLNTTSLAKGTYFLRATFQDGTAGTFKVVKE